MPDGIAVPCVQVVNAYLQFQEGLPIGWHTVEGVSYPAMHVHWPEMPSGTASLPANNPDGTTGTGDWVWLNPADLEIFLATALTYIESDYTPVGDFTYWLTTRNVIIFELLITCPGIWDMQNTSFTYTHNLPYLPGQGETGLMTMVDINSVFPLVLPENEQITVGIAWDYGVDIIGPFTHETMTAGDQASADQSAFLLNNFNYCISLMGIPFDMPNTAENELPANTTWPPPPPVTAPGGGGDSAAGGGAGTEADSSAESGGPPSSSGGTADEGNDSSIPGGSDSSTDTPAADMPPNSAVPGARYARKTRMNTKFKPEKGPSQGDKKRPSGINPNSRDILSSKKPLTRIAEYREAERGRASLAGGLLNLPGMVTRSAIENTPNQPGTTTVLSNQIFKQGAFSDIVGSRTEYLTTKVASRALGSSLITTDGKANPTYTLLNASELSGAGSLNLDAYTYKTPGKNIIELLAKHAVKAPVKTDVHGRLLKPASSKDGIASSSPTSAMELFLVNRLVSSDKFKTKNFFRRSTEPLSPTNANQDYEIPVSGDFNTVGDSNVIYNGGAGVFYGVGPFLNFESEEVLNGIFDIVNKSVALKAYTTVNDSSIVDTNLVTPASLGIVNRSKHRTEHGCLVILGILTSDQSFRWFAHNKINIRPSSYSFMNAIIPPGLAPGAARVIGMVFSSNNKLLVSSDESVVIAPDGYTVEGYTSQSPFLPGSLADLTNNPAWRYATRIYPRPGEKRRLVATADTVDFVVKIPQIASSRGLKTKLTVTDGSSTGVSSSRFAIDGVEIFPGAHNCYLQYSTTLGADIDIQVTDVEDKVHCAYAYTIVGSNLAHPTDLTFSGIANGSGYMGGAIQTPIINGLVVLNNNRNDYNTMVSTNHDGYMLLPVVSGYETGVAGQINQVVAGDTPYLGFDSLPGDGITVYAQGAAGQYNDVIVTGNLSLDSNALLPVSTYTLPSLPVFHCPLAPPNMNGDIIPAGDEPPENMPDPGDSGGLPPPPPTDVPTPGDGECVVCPTNEWKVETVQICQRPSNPCLIDITTNIYMCDALGNPTTAPSGKRYQVFYDLCSFSIDTTNGTDGSWHELVPLKTDTQHSGDGDFAIPGTYNYVADMCNHFSSFFSTQSIMFKIVFRVGIIGPDGNFTPDCTDAEILGL